MDYDVAVVGGGIVGMSLACGIAGHGKRVCLFDEGDQAFRASRGNFGLIWVQGKGDTLVEYARWTRRSAAAWPAFADALKRETGIDVGLAQPGGLFVCLDERDLAARAAMLEDMRARLNGDYPFQVLDRDDVAELVPEIGRDVAGATYGPEDGHVDPLRLLRALHATFVNRGGCIVNGDAVTDVAYASGNFTLATTRRSVTAERVVLAAGLGNLSLAGSVGLSAPVVPQRGQVLICERVRPFLNYPTGHVRQTAEGSVQIGDSKEDVGFDDGTTLATMAAIARRAVRMFPVLAGVRMVRAWGALRIMTPDGYPLYQRSECCPGAFVVSCHSGVTLAAAHAGPLSEWIVGGPQPFDEHVFDSSRFDVQAAA